MPPAAGPKSPRPEAPPVRTSPDGRRPCCSSRRRPCRKEPRSSRPASSRAPPPGRPRRRRRPCPCRARPRSPASPPCSPYRPLPRPSAPLLRPTPSTSVPQASAPRRSRTRRPAPPTTSKVSSSSLSPASYFFTFHLTPRPSSRCGSAFRAAPPRDRTFPRRRWRGTAGPCGRCSTCRRSSACPP